MKVERLYQRIRKIAAVAAGLYFCFMTYMLLTPLPPTGIIPKSIFSWIHFLAFALLGFLTEIAQRNRSGVLYPLLLCCWGVATEFIQPYTGRYFELIDIYQNLSGLCAGGGAAWFVRLAGFAALKKARGGRSGSVAILFRPPFRLKDAKNADLSKLEALVIRRSNQVASPGALCFPGGGIEDGETPAEAVAREFREEVGVSIRVGDLVAENATPDGAPLFWFLAELVDADDRDPKLTLQRDEVSGYEWRTLEDLLADDDFLPNNLEITRKIAAGDIPLP